MRTKIIKAKFRRNRIDGSYELLSLVNAVELVATKELNYRVGQRMTEQEIGYFIGDMSVEVTIV